MTDTHHTPTFWRSAGRDLLLIAAVSIVVMAGFRFFAPQRDSDSARRGAVASGAPYAFITSDAGYPATWPCRAGHTLGVNLEAVAAVARPGIERDLTAAVAAIEAVSNQRFTLRIVRGTVPTRAWGAATNDRSGVDILFAVGDARATDLSLPDTAASGGVFSDNGVIHAGYVYIDTAQLDAYTPGTGPGSRVALFTHELLHALNLDHVSDPTSVMVSRISAGSGKIGFGDIAGLAALDTAACRTR